MNKFVEPSAAEKTATEGLVGRRVNIWWDGDQVFYPCKIVGYQKEDGKHQVKYDNDDDGPICSENLSTARHPWKIWDGDDQEFSAYNKTRLKLAKKVKGKYRM